MKGGKEYEKKRFHKAVEKERLDTKAKWFKSRYLP